MRNIAGASRGPSVQSVQRALALLEILADEGGEMGVTELGRRLGVHKATASRLLATLAEHALVERNPLTDKYRLGFGVVRLAAATVGRLDLVQQARPVLEQLAERTGETVNLAILDQDWAVNIDQVTGASAVVSVSWVGKRTPLHATSSGKVLLAHAPAEVRERILSGPLPRLTRRTIVDPGALRRQLAEAVARGYAFTVEELEVGLNAVAAPVRQAGGEVVAAISVSGPAYRVTPARIPMLVQSVRLAAAEISRRMGHVERRESVAR
ncbi:MAG TPA: IclR family transcriptional regulator [Actinomycetota bacterium]|nr:IclR family transcriptional regulator [Actinomycetota bacterium]